MLNAKFHDFSGYMYIFSKYPDLNPTVRGQPQSLLGIHPSVGFRRPVDAKDLTKVRLKFDSFDLDKSGVIDAWERILFVFFVTLQGTNISHLGKRKIIFKYALSGGYVNFLEGNAFEFPKKIGALDMYQNLANNEIKLPTSNW